LQGRFALQRHVCSVRRGIAARFARLAAALALAQMSGKREHDRDDLPGR
jgi:hypothetical protein